jgi:hypothetical protein
VPVKNMRNTFLAVFGGMGGELRSIAVVVPIPKGLNLLAQGCEERATLGENEADLQP